MKYISKSLLVLAALIADPLAARVKVGQTAPNFKATKFDGTKVDISDFKGAVLVVNIWATWCVPCRKELPLLDAYLQAMEKHGLRVLAVTTEDSVPASTLKPLQAALTMQLARSFRGPYAAIGGAVPSNFIIDRSGVVRYAKAGAFDIDSLNALLVPLLNERGPAPASPVG